MARSEKRVTYLCPVCGWTGYVSSDGNKAFCPACALRGVTTDMRAGELKRKRRKVRVGRESIVRGEREE